MWATFQHTFSLFDRMYFLYFLYFLYLLYLSLSSPLCAALVFRTRRSAIGKSRRYSRRSEFLCDWRNTVDEESRHSSQHSSQQSHHASFLSMRFGVHVLSDNVCISRSHVYTQRETCVCTMDADKVEAPSSLTCQLSLLWFFQEHGQINSKTSNLES